MARAAIVDATFQERLYASQDLPVLPQIHLQAMRIAADPKGNAAKLNEIIRNDVSLAGKILKVANSAHYGFRNRIDSLQTAIVMLGIDEIMHIIATSSVMNAFDDNSASKEFEPHLFWMHSSTVGNVAGALTKAVKIRDAGDVYTAGLLHDVGKILLASRFTLEYDVCLKYSVQHDVHIRYAETHILGLDHTLIGAHLTRNWGLPDQLISIVRKHHTPQLERTYTVPVAIVHLANRISKRYGEGFKDDGDDSPLEKDKAWKTLQNHVPQQKIDVDKVVEKMIGEVRKSEEFVKNLIFSQ